MAVLEKNPTTQAMVAVMIYAVLARRFDHQRSAAAMSAAVGMALAIGLVRWEYQHGLGFRDLGPLAVGFAVFCWP